MTRLRRVAIALLLALPIEAGNLCLAPMMFDPGPFPTGIVSRLLQAEWVFFHFFGISMIDLLHKVLGTEQAGLISAFILAYLQTALLVFLIMEVVRRFRGRTSFMPQASPAHSSRSSRSLTRLASKLRKQTFTQYQEQRAKSQRFALQKAVTIAFELTTGLSKNGLAYDF